jgi:phosphoenolpyruvate carboxykinase (ATP)
MRGPQKTDAARLDQSTQRLRRTCQEILAASVQNNAVVRKQARAECHQPEREARLARTRRSEDEEAVVVPGDRRGMNDKGSARLATHHGGGAASIFVFVHAHNLARPCGHPQTGRSASQQKTMPLAGAAAWLRFAPMIYVARWAVAGKERDGLFTGARRMQFRREPNRSTGTAAQVGGEGSKGMADGTATDIGSSSNVMGRVNPRQTLEAAGWAGVARVHYNLIEPALVEAAVKRGEAALGTGGTLLVQTGKHTGRSPKDKFVVRENSVEPHVWWENNAPLAPEHFERLRSDMSEHIVGGELYVQDLYAGADPAYRLNVRVMTELAWHGLFIRHLLRRPEAEELAGFVPDFTILNCPSFKADPARHGVRSETAIVISFERKLILICGTAYAGENKKSVFSVLNYLLPEKGVMPMHCSANHGRDDVDDVALFFGLSGTGKTTLSADPARVLIGDDEHGWSEEGTFNFEGGCYAKTINLSPKAEPEIFATTTRFGTVIENMVHDRDTRAIDFADDSLTANTRCAYPLEAISNASATARGGHPKAVIMLTCDAFGVLPPIARLTPAQAEYHFLSGFTAKVAGTERGVTEPQPTFSTCFGAPFMPRRPEVYGDMLRTKIAEHGANCWLVNTGWTGGAHGTGERMPIAATRALLTAALDGSLAGARFRRDPNFGFEVPVSVPGVDDALLDPRSTWADPAAYDAQARKLVAMFAENFAQYEEHVGDDVRAAAVRAA